VPGSGAGLGAGLGDGEGTSEERRAMTEADKPWWTREWESAGVPAADPWAAAPPPGAQEQAWSGAPPPAPSHGAPADDPWRPVASGGPIRPVGSRPGPHGAGPGGRRGPWVAGGAALLVLMVLSGVIGGVIGAHTVHVNDTGAVGAPLVSAPVVARSGGASQSTVEAVAAAVAPSVVLITETTPSLTGTGSGVIIQSNGYILTNNHVVSEFATNGGTLTVTLNNGKTVPATVVGRDPSSDLAVVKINAPTALQAARLGNSASAVVGETVLAFGSPLGLQSTVTEGIVSAINRPVFTGDESVSDTNAVIDAIQTDAAINPGNSGGPLVDSSGDVIGIDSAIATLGAGSGTGTQSGSIGIGFAIPINSARTVASQLITMHHAVHAELGVDVQDAPNNGGAQVQGVRAGSGAARAGLQPGDVVTALDGQPVLNANALVVAVRNHNPGQRVSLSYTRHGVDHVAQVTLGSVVN
jgi:putative serine protease PepD